MGYSQQTGIDGTYTIEWMSGITLTLDNVTYGDYVMIETLISYPDTSRYDTFIRGNKLPNPLISYFADGNEVLFIISAASYTPITDFPTATSYSFYPKVSYFENKGTVDAVRVGIGATDTVLVTKKQLLDRFPATTTSLYTPWWITRSSGNPTVTSVASANYLPYTWWYEGWSNLTVTENVGGVYFYENKPLFKAEIPSIPFNTGDKTSGALWYAGNAEVTIPNWNHVAGGRINNLIPYPAGTTSVVTATTNATGGFDTIASYKYTTITVSFDTLGNCYSTWKVTDSRATDSANTVTSSVKTSSGSMMLQTSESYPVVLKNCERYLNNAVDAYYNVVIGGTPEINRNYQVLTPFGAQAMLVTTGNAVNSGTYSTVYGEIKGPDGWDVNSEWNQGFHRLTIKEVVMPASDWGGMANASFASVMDNVISVFDAVPLVKGYGVVAVARDRLDVNYLPKVISGTATDADFGVF
jgi:hypothetical protein